ncbi:hypothetical protein O181_113723 [Austropuccinia psidii MF-1]|uniref:Uncharacterized protein n=1 Tax=Austropuccinia psidii MF-1 TaxID=1389203 RepID=A0A9Q3PTX7_9BASI|nr:hypothetical protein [Austropuccinia psidii MF-1]
MTSSNPHKPHSGSVQDPNSESSIEYVQKQVPMSPNITPAVPMASLRNVGLNIEVRNAMDQTTSALMIANISFTEITLNPTNTQLQVHVRYDKRVDGEQQKQPLENVTCSGLSKWNAGLTLHQNMAPKGEKVQYQEQIQDCDERHSSLPLVHREKVTGCHHQYASNPRIGHASSSREKNDG